MINSFAYFFWGRLIRIARAFLVCGAFLIGAADALALPNVQDVDPLSQCLSRDQRQLFTRFSPIELYASAKHCVRQDKLDDAILLFGVAGSSGIYDTFRVRDVTAHQAVNFFGFIFKKELGEASSVRFTEYMKDQLASSSALQSFCETIKKIPPPNYHPQYMIRHGMVQMMEPGVQTSAMSKPDSEKAWTEAVDRYMTCTKQ